MPVSLLSEIVVLPHALYTGMCNESLLILISQLERNLGTAPNPLNWNVQRISLDTYSANLFQKSYTTIYG